MGGEGVAKKKIFWKGVPTEKVLLTSQHRRGERREEDARLGVWTANLLYGNTRTWGLLDYNKNKNEKVNFIPYTRAMQCTRV